MKTIYSNSVALAGEFAVLSQLALRGYDANMTLGHTKSVDILVSDPKKNKMYKLEVKTNFQNSRNKPSFSKLMGYSISGWIMHKKHETIKDPNVFYCFVNIAKDTNVFKFYIVPSKIVAKYVKESHAYYIRKTRNKDTDMRVFRVGLQKEKYIVATPAAEKYENNWNFKK